MFVKKTIKIYPLFCYRPTKNNYNNSRNFTLCKYISPNYRFKYVRKNKTKIFATPTLRR